MWIERLILDKLQSLPVSCANEIDLPTVRVLLGPRQVGKTSLLDRLTKYQIVSFDDFHLRKQAAENPSLFLDQYKKPVVLDEATLVPELFFEIKKRMDSAKRQRLKGEPFEKFDYWITGSTQALISQKLQESLAGRADFYYLNTLSFKELKKCDINTFCLNGGWPELYSHKLSATSGIASAWYLNNLISTSIEKDIVQAAGIEKKEAFAKTLHLLAGIIGEMINFADLASNVGVELTTIQSWALILEQNFLLKILPPYVNNLNRRLIKTPKLYFEDVGLAARLHGWTEFQPLFVSPYFGRFIENLAYCEFSRFFTNSFLTKNIYYVRNKEKVEIDFLIELPNKKFISAEVKTNPLDYTHEQLELLDSLKINIVEKWIVSPQERDQNFKNSKVIPFTQIFDNLTRLL